MVLDAGLEAVRARAAAARFGKRAGGDAPAVGAIGGGRGTDMMKATMYFAYGGDARPGIRSRTTFEAILAGERTSTTRYPAWPGYARWLTVKPGDVVRFYEDRAMQGRYVDVVVTAPPAIIDLAACDDAGVEAWSLAEGWSCAKARESGRRYGAGVQIRYRLRG